MLLLILISFGAFFVESIFGFGGTIILLGLAGLTLDFKTVVYISIYTGIIASSLIVLQSWRQIAWPALRQMIWLTLPGIVIGTLLVSHLASPLLLKIFAVFLLAYGLQSLVLPHWQPPKLLRYSMVGLGGLTSGLFTAGGPFILMGMREAFANKTALRATMAVFFGASNILRLAIDALQPQGQVLTTIAHYWWLAMPVLLAIWLGHHVHHQLPEAIFKKAMTFMLLGIAVLMLFK